MKNHPRPMTFIGLAWWLGLSGCMVSGSKANQTESVERNESAAASQQSDASIEQEPADEAFSHRVLNLRVHIMRNISFTVLGVKMTNSHVSASSVRDELVPELNRIWAPAGVFWRPEAIVEEDAIRPANYLELKSLVESAARDENGRSDEARLAPLYSFMDPALRSTRVQLDRNLFHIYIFPFIGNTSQGNAMREFGFHAVVGSWSNKHNGGAAPARRQNIEDPSRCVNGSLGRTIAHELGHVLTLQHNQCTDCLMSGCGYSITSNQISSARAEAKRRMQ